MDETIEKSVMEALPSFLQSWNLLYALQMERYYWCVLEKDQKYTWLIKACNSADRHMLSKLPGNGRNWETPRESSMIKFNTIGGVVGDVTEVAPQQRSFRTQIFEHFAGEIRKEFL